MSVAAHGSGGGGDDTKDAVYTDINGRNGGDTAVLLGRVNGSITLSPEAKITGGGGLAYLTAGASTCAGHRGGNIGVTSSEHGTSVPIKLSVIYGTEVPCSENNNLA